jgi:hypothetical protein
MVLGSEPEWACAQKAAGHAFRKTSAFHEGIDFVGEIVELGTKPRSSQWSNTRQNPLLIGDSKNSEIAQHRQEKNLPGSTVECEVKA